MGKFLAFCVAVIVGIIAGLVIHMVAYIVFKQPLSGMLLKYGAVMATLGVVAHGWVMVKCAKLAYRRLTKPVSLAEERARQINQAIDRGDIDESLITEFKEKLNGETSQKKVNAFLCALLEVAESLDTVTCSTDRIEYTIYGLFIADIVIDSKGGDSNELLSPYVDQLVSVIDQDFECSEDGEEVFSDRLVAYSMHIGEDGTNFMKIHEQLAVTMSYSRKMKGFDTGLEGMYIGKGFIMGANETVLIASSFNEVFKETLQLIEKEGDAIFFL